MNRNGGAPRSASHRAKDVRSRPVRQANIANDRGRAACGAAGWQIPQGLGARAPPANLCALQLQALDERFAHDRIVLDQRREFGSQATWLSSISCRLGIETVTSVPPPRLLPTRHVAVELANEAIGHPQTEPGAVADRRRPVGRARQHGDRGRRHAGTRRPQPAARLPPCVSAIETATQESRGVAWHALRTRLRMIWRTLLAGNGDLAGQLVAPLQSTPRRRASGERRSLRSSMSSRLSGRIIALRPVAHERRAHHVADAP